MNVFYRKGLIPRNNWDFGLSEVLISLKTLLSAGICDISAIEGIFGRKTIPVGTGRSALYAILKALEIPAGSKVGVPLFCCPVVFHAIREAGLIPCFIDSDSSGFNIAPTDIKNKIDGLSALVVVHMFGIPCEMDTIMEIAGKVPVIEDCAHSLYSTYNGKLTGTLSTASFFSFRCGKYLSAGECGLILTDNADLEKKICEVLRDFDKPSSFESVKHTITTWIKALFYNRPLYGIVGLSLGKYLDEKLNLTAKEGFEKKQPFAGDLSVAVKRITRFRKKIALQKKNSEKLINEIMGRGYILPDKRFLTEGNAYLFPLVFHDSSLRDEAARKLFLNNIDTSKYLNEVVAVATEDYGYDGTCPGAEKLSAQTLLVPVYYRLNKRDIRCICNSINKLV